ncbi:zf-HC2 domain-containing protein [Paenibacillus alginolyticus]|uniref:anti-sigma factor family protein n=1 Tax=Paenibacillus alginolyticus TaxID=59839 RepID=UPI0004126C4B|nr:zf-HC2 domain-containing protein [Paenibacillus alginolyticus]MCY9667404.1 zf-HC2 domain-containing protein [Paenibacillus alginolyticus]
MPNHPEDLLSAYIDNELTAKERQQVEEHLHSCTQCQLLAADLLELQQQVSTVFLTMDAPRDMEQRIMYEVELQTRAPFISRNWLALPLAGVICLTAVWYFFGSVFFSLLSVLFKFVVALLYAFSGMVTSIPTLTGATAVFAIFIVIISSFSLRRLLTTTTN